MPVIESKTLNNQWATENLVRPNQIRWFAWLLMILIMLLAGTQLLWVTALGPGVHEDSYSYMDTAWALLNGYGFLRDGKPMTHFAPGYPVLLAASYLADGDFMHAARWLNVFLYSINIALVGVAGYIITEQRVLGLVAAPLVIMSSGALLTVFSTAASELPFLTLALAGFILLALHIMIPRRILLLGGALFFGTAVAMRYVGITLVPAGVACLWIMQSQPLHRRVRECFVFSLLAFLPLTAWIIRNLLVVASPTDRIFAVHPITVYGIKVFVSNLCSLLLPLNTSTWFKLIVLGSIAAVIIVQLYRHPPGITATALVFVSLVFCLVYIAFLFVSVSFLDASTDFDSRILAPIGFFSLIITVSLSVIVITTADPQWIRWGSAVFLVYVIGANVIDHWRVAPDLHREGFYFSSRKWRESETLAFLRSAPQGVRIYSNHPHAIGYVLGRRARMLPDKISPLSLKPNQDYPRSLREMCDDLAGTGAIVAFFEHNRWHLPSAEELQAACGIGIIQRTADGVIFGYTKDTSHSTKFFGSDKHWADQ